MAFSIVVLFVMACILAIGWWKEVELNKEFSRENYMLKITVRALENNLERASQAKQDVIDYVNSLSDRPQVQDD